VTLYGDLRIPEEAKAIVLFAQGIGSRQRSSRNRRMARRLRREGFATMLIDLLTGKEEALDLQSGTLRFDIGLLSERLVSITNWLVSDPRTRHLRIGFFGASTGVAAALVAAAVLPQEVDAVVSSGGRPDLAGPLLGLVRAPTLFIVGGQDLGVLELNVESAGQLVAESQVEIVPGAGHLLDEPGALDRVANLAASWFQQHLLPGPTLASVAAR
jgi:dienelactone hydrolase